MERKMKISKDKKYKIRIGGDVKIYEILGGYIFGAYNVDGSKEWSAARWESNGNYQLDKESCLDLIEVSPYADFNIDDKVLVWDNGLYKYKCHFAGVGKNGKPLTWDDGKTSFTETDLYKTEWDNCEKYEENNDNK